MVMAVVAGQAPMPTPIGGLAASSATYPMPDGGPPEAFLTTDYNADMIEHIDRFPWVRDRAIFVGQEPDVVPETFGATLPSIRDWTTHAARSGPSPHHFDQRWAKRVG